MSTELKDSKARLEPRKSKHGFSFMFDKDIKEFHGEEWYKKFNEEMIGSTCPIIDAPEDLPEGYAVPGAKYALACYSWDYTRFADLIDYNKPTYFD